MEERVTSSNVTAGMRVIDYAGDVGTVKDCSDMHNVNVEYDSGGSGLWCLEQSCDEFDGDTHPLYKHKS